MKQCFCASAMEGSSWLNNWARKQTRWLPLFFFFFFFRQKDNRSLLTSTRGETFMHTPTQSWFLSLTGTCTRSEQLEFMWVCVPGSDLLCYFVDFSSITPCTLAFLSLSGLCALVIACSLLVRNLSSTNTTTASVQTIISVHPQSRKSPHLKTFSVLAS